MAKASEEISKYKANSSAKPDSNIANDSLHLGGIEADEYATKDYVQKYHNTKEENLKQNINVQDRAILEKAKAYSDEVVNNQDFSSFAKVTDVQAIDSKLSQKISNQNTEQKNYTDGKIQSVVNDVNTNFDNVGKSIESLNNTTNQLFQSVSNGKSKVAAAITDKGVDTASDASFDDMANNIKNISSSSGGGDVPTDPNFVNTGDATAETSDIMSGKIAYSLGQKVYGTHVCEGGIDTGDATATPYDILTGKTAYARSSKITGILSVNSSGNPSYDAGSVEPIYGTVTTGYKVRALVSSPTASVNSSSVIYNSITGKPEYEIYISSSTVYVEAITEWTDTFYNTGNKQEFTFSDLGIINTDGTSSNYKLQGFAVSTINIKRPYIVILVSTESSASSVELNLIPFSTIYDEDANIRKIEFDTSNLKHETISTDSFKIDLSYLAQPMQVSSDGKLIVSRIAHFRGSGGAYELYFILINVNLETLNIQYSITKYYESGRGASINFYFKIINNKYIFAYDDNYYNTYIFMLTDSGNLLAKSALSNNFMAMSSDGKYIITKNNEKEFVLNSITLDYDKATIKVSKIKTFKVANGDENYLINTSSIKKEGIIVGENKYFIFLGSAKAEIYEINFEADEILTYIDSTDLVVFTKNCQIFDDCFVWQPNKGGFSLSKDYSRIIGVKYNGDYYYKKTSDVLTARPEDVTSGKTFIGKLGEQEIGTMEVQK